MWKITHLPLKCGLRMIKAVRKYPQNNILPVLKSKYSGFLTAIRASKSLTGLCIYFYEKLPLWLAESVVRQMHKITTCWTSFPIHLCKLPHPHIKIPTNMFHMFKKTTSFHYIKEERQKDTPTSGPCELKPHMTMTGNWCTRVQNSLISVSSTSKQP